MFKTSGSGKIQEFEHWALLRMPIESNFPDSG